MVYRAAYPTPSAPPPRRRFFLALLLLPLAAAPLVAAAVACRPPPVSLGRVRPSHSAPLRLPVLEHVISIRVDDDDRICATTFRGDTLCRAPTSVGGRPRRHVRDAFRRIPSAAEPAADSPFDPSDTFDRIQPREGLAALPSELAAPGVPCVRLNDGTVRCGNLRSPAAARTGLFSRGSVAWSPPTDPITQQLMNWPEPVHRVASTGDDDYCAVGASGAIRCLHVGEVRYQSNPVVARARASITGAVDLVGVPGGGCALVSDGRLRCWGGRRDSAPTGQSYYREQFQRVAGLPPIASLAVSNELACAVSRRGEVWCWGANDFNQVDDSGVDRAAAGRIAGLTDITRLWIDGRSVVAMDSRRALYRWGSVERRQVMCGIVLEVPTSPERFGVLAANSELARSQGAPCTIDTHDAVRCGEYDPFMDSPLQVTFDPAFSGMTPVAAGVCARVGASDVACWEAFTNYDHRHFRRNIPSIASLLPGHSGDACALTTDGAVLCWSPRGPTYALRDADRVPIRLPPNGRNITIDADRACITWRDDRVTCTGTGVDPSALRDVTDVALATDLVCALDRFGQVFCAGRNERGQLGDGVAPPDGPADAVFDPR